MSITFDEKKDERIVVRRNGFMIGEIRWHSRAKEYIFFSCNNYLYWNSELLEISNRCSNETKMRNEN